MIVTREERHRGRSLQEPAEQEARTKLPYGFLGVLLWPCGLFSVPGSSDPDTNDKIPNLVRASHSAGGDCTRSVKRSLLTSSRQFRSIQRQAAEYRARSAGRQLGGKLLELIKKTLPKPSFYFFFFSDYPSSEVNYTGLERG